jgi:hypothetical protein
MKSHELIWLSFQFGRVSGYFQYKVSGRISGKSHLVFGRIPVIKKAGLFVRIFGASPLKNTGTFRISDNISELVFYYSSPFI